MNMKSYVRTLPGQLRVQTDASSYWTVYTRPDGRAISTILNMTKKQFMVLSSTGVFALVASEAGIMWVDKTNLAPSTVVNDGHP